jgi:3-deoxy-D-manno-octulosonic-acid transferase
MILYQLLMALALPFILGHQAIFGARGALAERLGRGAEPLPGPSLWLHGASVGEVTSARWVIEALLRRRPGLQVLVTTNTATGRDTVRRWGLAGVTAALAPLDSAGAAGRVLDRWRPQALILVENELWPARLWAADNRGVPVLVIGARMSARSARRWRFGAGLIRGSLQRIRWLSAQDEASEQRLIALGLDAAALGPVVALKSRAAAKDRPAPFAPVAARSATLLAASTHPGEEALILDAFQAAPAFDHLILAPRHPKRGAELAQMLRARGLAFAQWSQGEVPGPQTRIFLADTLGDMDHWYRMAGVTVIGGSFAPKGGHTPWEPAAYGSALVHGPSVENFADRFAALDAGKAALRAADAPGLAAALVSMTPARQAEMASAATLLLQQGTEDPGFIDAIWRVIRG